MAFEQLQLLSLETYVPTSTVSRSETLAALPVLAGGEEQAERFRPSVERSQIDARHVEMPLEMLRNLGIGDRSRVYEQRSRVVAEDLGRRALAAAGIDGNRITAVIPVSCTGYMLPSVDAYVMPRLGIAADARRIPITELGCSAGVGAIALAAELLAGGSGRALVLSIELCSSCLQTQDLAPTDVIGNILFADAAGAVVIGAARERHGPQVLATRSTLWPDTTDALGMHLSDTGLRLVLSPHLPAIISERLQVTVNDFLGANGITQSDVGFWVVHPGGPRILEAVGQRLQLSEEMLAPSWSVWRRCGNVSSATVFLILHEIRARRAVPAGQFGVMMAFGPGLTCELVLLRADGWLSAPKC